MEATNRGRCQALTAALAFSKGDRRAFERATDDVFERASGYHELVAGLCDLVVESFDCDHQGDRVAVAEAIRVRRELAAEASAVR
ncbi:hypothetical protein ACIGKQ_03930 [Gordonia sp. NPDC062954]|uniref:hypothetical protein n=1 Tax=Gordonia sp. NPDC062954 TaxID=3364003 RepID=UPI0037C65D9C